MEQTKKILNLLKENFIMKCLIVDDDVDFSNQLSKYIDVFLSKIFNKYNIKIQTDHFTDMSIYYNIDLLFIDIDLNNINGIGIVHRLDKIKCDYPIIYVSSRKELVFSSLSTHPFYFIRKQNLDRDMKELFRLLDVYYKKTMKLITFNYYGRKTSIFLKNIHYIESYGKDVSVITNNEVYTYRSGLKQTLDLLDNKYIIRVHRNYAVSLMYVKEIDRSNIILNDNTILPIGKKYSNNLLNLYKDYIIS